MVPRRIILVCFLIVWRTVPVSSTSSSSSSSASSSLSLSPSASSSSSSSSSSVASSSEQKFVAKSTGVATAEAQTQSDQPFTSILYTAVDGGKVALPCNIIPPTIDDHVVLILWYKDEEFEPIYTIDARKDPLENAQVISSSSLADRVYFNQHNVPAFLQLDPVQVRDAGEYRCRVDFKKARTVNTVIQLKVIVPPEEPIISYRYPQISQKSLKGLIGPFNEGDTLALQCTTFGGKPRPTLTWWKDYSVIDDTFEYKSKDVTVNELVINSLARHHLLSIFTCQAINNNITIASSASITIDLNLKPLEVKIKQLTPILLAGEDAKFECSTFGSKPKAKIYWMFDGARYDTTFQGDMQTISIISLPLKRSHNNRILSCFAENLKIANSTLSDNLVLNVEYKPELSLQLGTSTLSLDSIQEGNDIYFECVVDSNPLPDRSPIQWRFNDQLLEPRQGIIQSNYSLALQRVQRRMSGKYQCEATNRHGTALSNQIELNIRFAPYCKFSSTLAYGLSLHESAKLLCEVESNPPPLAFYWKFERESDLVSSRLTNFSSVVHFRPNSTQHYGTIECTAKNEIGIQQVPCKYHIIDSGPPIFPFYCGLHNQSISRVTIKCTREQMFTNDVREQPHKSPSSSSFSSSASASTLGTNHLKTQTIFVHPTTFYIAEVYDRAGKLEQNITLHTPLDAQSLKVSSSAATLKDHQSYSRHSHSNHNNRNVKTVQDLARISAATGTAAIRRGAAVSTVEVGPRDRELENVFVAVRIRPFSLREKKRSAKLIVEPLDTNRLILKHAEDADSVKQFTFDRLYWSHNGFTEAHNGLLVPDPSAYNSQMYCDQQTLYQHLAVPLINNAWKGYNVSLFAYGQTGSGKSYTMIGNAANRGIIPRVCEDIFSTIENRRDLNIKIEVTLSMLELYSEVVRDLLDVDSLARNGRRGLKVREHPTKGFFAEGLQSFLVTNYDEIQKKIDQGITNRSISATNMNETSSRSHMIILIHITQRFANKNGHEETKSSSINLVDLAGSERLSDLARDKNESVSADRFKESVAINQSLSCLGNCIHALSEKAMGKNVKVPYRESALTRLLMHALGGNSKTAMIANISPADINYEDTLSTLRYADRAKQIQNCARVNTESTEKIIRELKDENDKLKRLLERESLATADTAATSTFYEETKTKLEDEIGAIMHENEKKLSELRQSYEERLLQERNVHSSIYDHEQQRQRIEHEKQFSPFLSNLNFDEQLMGKIIFILKTGTNTIGKDQKFNTIQLHGPLIQDRHAVINRTERNKIVLERIDEDCRILINGDPVLHKVNLTHNDRLLFGASQLYVFKNPLCHTDANDELSPEVTFEIAQEEIAAKAGFEINSDDHSMEQALLNQELLELFPAVEEANAISEELDKMVKFQIVLVAPIFLGKIGRKSEPHVKVTNTNTGQEFEWNRVKFFDRLYLMREMYFNYESGEEEWDLPFDQDPFMEDIEMECLIGTAQLYLQPLAYKIEVKEQLAILNYSGQEIGIMNVEAVPANHDGMEYSEHDDVFVDSPHEMLGKPLILSLKINGCRGLPPKYTDIYVRYRMFVDDRYTVSEKITTPINPDMNFRELFQFEQVTQQLLEYLKEGILNLEVWGRQLLRSSLGGTNGDVNGEQKFIKPQKNHTLQEELAKHGNELMKGFKMNGRVIDPNKQSIIVELLLMKKEQARMHQRIDNIKRLIDIAERQRRRFIPLHILKELIFTTTSESADPILTQLLNDESYTLRDLNNSAACTIS